MKQEFETPRHLELICQKGVYPYEWVDGEEQFKREGLPPREAFYSKLKLSDITEKSTNTHSRCTRSLAVKPFGAIATCI